MTDNGTIYQSFELVYYDPDPAFRGRTAFEIAANSGVTTEQRIEYISRYAEAIKAHAQLDEARALSYPVLGDDEVQEALSRLKPPPQPQVRRCVPLRYWRWRLGGAELALEWVEPDYVDDLWMELEAPTVLDMHRSMLLRTTVQAVPAERYLLDIESIQDAFRLWVDGSLVVEHDGYEPVTLDVTRWITPEREQVFALEVPYKEGNQIGIAGEVALVCTSQAYVSDLYVKTLRAEEEKDAEVRAHVTVMAPDGEGFVGSLEVELEPWHPESGPVVARASAALRLDPGAEQAVTLDLVVKEPRLWSPDSPNLHLARARLLDASGRAVDDSVQSTGLRTIEHRDGRLYLNGKRFVLRSLGNNLGFAPSADSHGTICPPDEWLVRDMLLAKRANANGMRLHAWGFSGVPGKYNEYGWPEWGIPTDGTNYSRIADVADQLGLCLQWLTRYWGFFAEGLRLQVDIPQMGRLLTASIRRVRNHPSIIIWEGLNEAGLHIGARQFSKTVRLEGWESEGLVGPYAERFEEFCAKYIQTVNSVDDSRLIAPDAMWGPLHQRLTTRVITLKDESIYKAAPNVLWTAHYYGGWYSEMDRVYALAEDCWREDRAWACHLSECGGEAMPDYRRYRGLPWASTWLNNDRPCRYFEILRLGRGFRMLDRSEVHLSQAYQGLCIWHTVMACRMADCDGTNINLIADGLMEGQYHKGVTDLHRLAKLGYHCAKMAYQPAVVAGINGDYVLSSDDPIRLKVAHEQRLAGARAQLTVEVRDVEGTVVARDTLDVSLGSGVVTDVGEYRLKLEAPALYEVHYELRMR